MIGSQSAHDERISYETAINYHNNHKLYEIEITYNKWNTFELQPTSSHWGIRVAYLLKFDTEILSTVDVDRIFTRAHLTLVTDTSGRAAHSCRLHDTPHKRKGI